jgi:hypothetical protein
MAAQQGRGNGHERPRPLAKLTPYAFGMPESADPESLPGYLEGPLGTIMNTFRALRDTTDENEQIKLRAEIKDQVSRLQGAVSFWAADDRAGKAITVDLVRKAMEHVEGGGRIVRSLAKQLVERLTNIPEKNQEQAIESLTQNDTFKGIETYVSYIDPLAPHGRAYAELTEQVRDRVESALAEKYNFSRSAYQEKKHPETAQVLERRLAKLSDLWRDNGPTPERTEQMLTTARRSMGTGLSRILDRLLYTAEFKNDDGEKVRVNEAILRRLRNSGFSGYQLSGSDIQDALESAQNAYEVPRPAQRLVLDRPIVVGEREEAKRKVSVSATLSKIAYALKSEEEGRRPQRRRSFFGRGQEEKETFPLEASIAEFKALVRARLNGITKQKDKLPAFEESIQAILDTITEQKIRDLYKEAKKTVRKPDDPSLTAEKVLAAQRDPFIQLVRGLGHQLFSQKSEAQGPTLTEVFQNASNGQFTESTFAGVWLDEKVAQLVEAESAEGKSGAKAGRVLEFVLKLPQIADDAVAKSRDLSDSEKEEIRRAAQALSSLISQMELRRRIDTAVDEKGQKGGARQTAGIQERYEGAYAILFDRGLVPSLSIPLPERQENESDEAYERRRRAARETAKSEFEAKRADAFIKQTREFLAKSNPGALARLTGRVDLGETYFSTLGFALARSGRDLADTIREEMEALRTDRSSERGHDWELPEGDRAALNTVRNRTADAEQSLKSFGERAHQFLYNARHSEDPGMLIASIAEMRELMDGTLLYKILMLHEQLRPFRPAEQRAKLNTTDASRMWETVKPYIDRFNRLKAERNTVYGTLLTALAIAYLRDAAIGIRNDLKNPQELSDTEIRALQKQVTDIEELSTKHALPHLLRQKVSYPDAGGTLRELKSYTDMLQELYGTDILDEFKFENLTTVW